MVAYIQNEFNSIGVGKLIKITVIAHTGYDYGPSQIHTYEGETELDVLREIVKKHNNYPDSMVDKMDRGQLLFSCRYVFNEHTFNGEYIDTMFIGEVNWLIPPR